MQINSRSDRIILDAESNFSLSSDYNQWIVSRRRNKRDTVRWKPFSFIGSTKSILLRVLRENGIELSPQAKHYIDQLPERFLDTRKKKAKGGSK